VQFIDQTIRPIDVRFASSQLMNHTARLVAAALSQCRPTRERKLLLVATQTAPDALPARAQLCDFSLAGRAQPLALASASSLALTTCPRLLLGALLAGLRRLLAGNIPELHAAIHPRGRKPRTGMRESHKVNPALVTREAGNLLVAFHAPEPDDIV